MIEEAKAKGLTSEKEMWQGIALIDELLCEIKEEHPDLYWAVIRDQFGIFNKGHYNEEFARYDVSEMQPVGEYWSCKDIEEATKGMAFPAGTTIWDKYVAFNGMANDLQGEEDAIILKVAYKFYFADKDWHNGNKLWHYMKIAKRKS